MVYTPFQILKRKVLLSIIQGYTLENFTMQNKTCTHTFICVYTFFLQEKGHCSSMIAAGMTAEPVILFYLVLLGKIPLSFLPAFVV